MPFSFKDNAGVEWTFSFTAGTAIALKRDLDVDLGALTNGPFATFLAKIHDAPWLVSALYVICKKQRTELGLDADAFAERFGGDEIEAACDAFAQATFAFMGSKRREIAKQIYADFKSVQMKLNARAEADLGKIDTDAVVDRIIAEQQAPPAPTE